MSAYQQSDQTVRTGMYRFLGTIFAKEPEGAILEQLRSVRFAPDGPLGEAGAAWNACAADDAACDPEELAVDFARVFLGAGLAEAAAAFPFESVYTSPKRIIMQDAWSQMHEILGNRRLAIARVSSDLLEDHISVELDYMAWLCERAGTQEQEAFLKRHLANWVPAFCEDIRTYAGTAFHKAAAGLLEAFIAADAAWLDRQNRPETASIETAPIDAAAVQDVLMAAVGAAAGAIKKTSVFIRKEDLSAIFNRLQERFDIYGPVEDASHSADGEPPVVRFARLNGFEEIVCDRQSDFSPKEIYYPISQVLFRFDEHNYTTVLKTPEKPVLIFAHPCDINGIRRLDDIFLKNGGQADLYYETMRSHVRFAMLECNGGYPGCWCVSMGTNKADDYVLAVRLAEEGAAVQIADPDLIPLFEEGIPCPYTPAFVEKNIRTVRIPRISKVDELQKVFDLDFWKEYNEKCISCGGCNTVCPTCACYETADYLDQENSRKGERRRVWASCMIPEFTRTAGGHVARPAPDKLMRFKTLHKVYDYNLRFGGSAHMCVGCGRCVLRCPEDIDFCQTINRLYDETERLIREQEVRA